jgi:hypothetical protein
MRVQCRVLMIVAMLCGATRDSVEGQDQPTDCRQVVQNVKARATPQRYVDALRDLRDGCPGTAAGVLVQQWQNPPVDSLSFTFLVDATAKVRAREVSEALLAVAASETASRGRRFGAIRALASHFRPCLTLIFLPVTTRLDRTYVPVARGRVPDVDPADRAQSGVPELILQRLDDLGRTSSDAIFREAVRQAAFLMRLDAEGGKVC